MRRRSSWTPGLARRTRFDLGGVPLLLSSSPFLFWFGSVSGVADERAASSPDASHAKGAVTRLFIVPRSDDGARFTAGRAYGCDLAFALALDTFGERSGSGMG